METKQTGVILLSLSTATKTSLHVVNPVLIWPPIFQVRDVSSISNFHSAGYPS